MAGTDPKSSGNLVHRLPDWRMTLPLAQACPRCGARTRSGSPCNMFAAMAQFEREIMLERQREGIAKAKAEGKYKGRKPTARAKAKDAVEMFRAGKRVAHIAKHLGIGRGSVYRALEAAGLTAER